VKSVLGSILDPAADKALMTTLVATLAWSGMLPRTSTSRHTLILSTFGNFDIRSRSGSFHLCLLLPLHLVASSGESTALEVL
jgi:hypothetical protein